MSAPATVLAWAMEHSRATGRNLDVLLSLAFWAEDDSHIRTSGWAQAQQLDLTGHEWGTAIEELCESEELAEAQSDHIAPVYWFPAYQAWLVESCQQHVTEMSNDVSKPA